MNEIKEMKEQHIEIDEHGDKYYYSDKKMTVRHREDGPAVERADGSKFWYVDGKLHREDGPAIEWDGGSKAWYIDGNCHREDGPAIESANGTKKWYINGELHREDGPAIEDADGSKEWYINGERHREDGPAFEAADGCITEWYIDGKCHREDGPAVETSGYKAWYINDKKLTEEEFNDRNKTEFSLDERRSPQDQEIRNSNIIKEMKEHKEMKEQYIKIDENGDKYYYSDKEMTVLHREDGPAVEEVDGYKVWYINGERHREDGPAVESAYGYSRTAYKMWWVNGKQHREDGPAYEDTSGYKEWWVNGKQHREDGPAVEDVDGCITEWWVNGEEFLTEDGFNDRNKVEFTREEWFIDGKKLTEEQFKNHLTLLPKNRRSRVERVLRYALCSDSRR